MILTDRLTARLEGEFAVFLIGMRINRFWKVGKWLPVALAMPRMLKELSSDAGSGLLSYEMWFGRTIVVVACWRSSAQLMAYAKNRAAEHLPAWRAFNKAVGTSGDVGVWHETYVIAPHAYENVYVNMPPFGLGKAGSLAPASGALRTAEGRLGSRVPADAPGGTES